MKYLTLESSRSYFGVRSTFSENKAKDRFRPKLCDLQGNLPTAFWRVFGHPPFSSNAELAAKGKAMQYSVSAICYNLCKKHIWLRLWVGDGNICPSRSAPLEVRHRLRSAFIRSVMRTTPTWLSFALVSRPTPSTTQLPVYLWRDAAQVVRVARTMQVCSCSLHLRRERIGGQAVWRLCWQEQKRAASSNGRRKAIKLAVLPLTRHREWPVPF